MFTADVRREDNTYDTVTSDKIFIMSTLSSLFVDGLPDDPIASKFDLGIIGDRAQYLQSNQDSFTRDKCGKWIDTINVTMMSMLSQL